MNAFGLYHFIFYKLYKYSLAFFKDGETESPLMLATFSTCGLALINIIGLMHLGDHFLGLNTCANSTPARVLIFGCLFAANYFMLLHGNKYEPIVTQMDEAYQRRRIAENVLFWGTVLFSLSLLAIGEYASGNTSWLN